MEWEAILKTTAGIVLAHVVFWIFSKVLYPPMWEFWKKLFKPEPAYARLRRYPDMNAASDDVKADLQRDGEVLLFFMRGFSFTDISGKFFEEFWAHKGGAKVLLADPGDEFGHNQAASDRGGERVFGVSKDGPARYRDGVNHSIRGMIEHNSPNSEKEARIHLQPSCLRFYLFEKRVYFSFYERGKGGAQLPVFRADFRTEIYDGLKRYHQKVWKIRGMSRSIDDLKYEHNPEGVTSDR
ncbi:MAG: hypothetical protein GY835_16530 [bacterium]|nr:hypothetical protein [bacterium]